MSKKYKYFYCSPEAHKKIKSKAAEEGKTVVKYFDDIMSVEDKSNYKNIKGKNWGKLF